MRNVRAVIIAPVAVRYDAISTAAKNTFLILKQNREWNVCLITNHSELTDISIRVVSDLLALISDPEFLSADLIIYHFGIYHPFFDALLIGNGHAKQVVRFHNITPPDLVDRGGRPLIYRSFQQLHNFRKADLIWADSSLNAEVLEKKGIDPAKVEVIPLVVNQPGYAPLGSKHSDTIEVLFVGRGVRSKGVMDCIEAFRIACREVSARLHLTVVCASKYSDPIYLAHCKNAIEQFGLNEFVSFLGSLDDFALADAYFRAHILIIPSYHEGFCVPVIEGLRAGCVPLGYAAGNLPCIVAGLGCLVPTGDIERLAGALLRLSDSIRDGGLAHHKKYLPLDRGMTSVAEFESLAKTYIARFSMASVGGLTQSSLSTLFRSSCESRRKQLHAPDDRAGPGNLHKTLSGVSA